MTDYLPTRDSGRGWVAKRFARELEFPARRGVRAVEEGRRLMPWFGPDGLIACIAQDAFTGEVLMLGCMNREALSLTIQSGYAHYWSRSRRRLWSKGERSGQQQRVESILIDDDQDCVLLKVELTGGASCDVGYRSCFFRQLKVAGRRTDFSLRFLESVKVYNPAQACRKAGQD